MARGEETDFAALMEQVAIKLLGKPTTRKAKELRWGRQGSMSVDLTKGTFFDHEACEGGGVIDLIKREKKTTVAGALKWLEENDLRGGAPVASPSNIIDRSLRGFWVGSDGFDVRFVNEPATEHGVTLRPEQRIVATFAYHDDQGALLYRSHRIEPGDKGANKTFRQDRPDGKGGWIANAGEKRVPYRLPELMASAGPVYLVEGERQADKLASWGLTATSLKNWSAEFSQIIAGREVIILPDNDAPGQKQAHKARALLEDANCAVRVIHLPGLPDKGDVIDWQGNADDLASLVSQHQSARPTAPLPFEWAGEIEPVIDGFWLVDDWLPANGIAAVYGHPGCGKSFLTFHMAAHVAAGKPWAGRRVEQGLVVYVVAEGTTGARNRLYAMRQAGEIAADAPFAIVPTPIDMQAESGDVKALIETIEVLSAIKSARPALIVLDTLSKTFGAGKENTDDMVNYVNNCQRVASSFDCLTLVVHHRPKDQESKDLRGHSSLRGNVDTTILVEAGEIKTATTLKQKDGEDHVQVRFKLHQVTIGKDRHGKDRTTCLVEITDEMPSSNAGETLSSKEIEALRAVFLALQKHPNEHVFDGTGELLPCALLTDWRAELRASGTIDRDNDETARKQFYRLRKSLKLKGVIEEIDGFVRPHGTGGT